ncbi:MAG TPA: acylphosphatase [Desulfobulbaceae bacterium]|nr:acylphosphatase [Desulfobulbaceae bacterium]
MKKKCIHAVVHGRVQGVYFRDYTRREARHLGVCGWVRNLIDGTVEVVAEGAPEDVDRFLAWLHEGSPMSKVTAVDFSEETQCNNYSSFVVRYG